MCALTTEITGLCVFCFIDWVFLQVPLEDLFDASKLLIQAMNLRWQYCRDAKHTFPVTTTRFLRWNMQNHPDGSNFCDVEPVHDEKMTVEGTI